MRVGCISLIKAVRGLRRSYRTFVALVLVRGSGRVFVAPGPVGISRKATERPPPLRCDKSFDGAGTIASVSERDCGGVMCVLCQNDPPCCACPI